MNIFLTGIVSSGLFIGGVLFTPQTCADGLSIDEVIIYGKKQSLVGDTISASEGSISQSDLAARALLRTGEVLEAVPGLVATQHSGSGKANQYFLRGFNLDHGTDFATSIDSMPVNMRSHGHGQGYTDLNFIIPELIGGIHYKKGPYYADTGDFSGTGSAEIAVANSIENKISLGVGDSDFYRGLVAGELETAPGKLVYGVEYQTYQGPWDSVDENVGKTNLWLKHYWNTENTRYSLSFMGYHNHWNSADQIPQRAVDHGIISSFGSIDSTLGGESDRYSLAFSFNNNFDEHTRLIGHVYGINYDLDLWSNFSYFTQPKGDQFQQTDHRNIYGGDMVITRASDDSHMINTLGLQTRYDQIDKLGLTRTQARQALGPIRTDAIDEASVSAYWENTLEIAPNLRSAIGLRRDYFSFDVKPLTAGDSGSLALNGGKATDSITTAKASLIYSLNRQQEIYTSLGQGFHSNDARGVTIKVDPATGNAIAPVDPLVKTLGYELGWRGNFANRLNASVALWQLAIDSELLYVGDEGITEDTGIGSHRRGVEITTYYQLTPAWTLDMEYAWTHARFDEQLNGSRSIPGALKQVITAGVHWQAMAGFSVDMKWRHFAGYPLDGSAQAAASDLVNLRLDYAFTDRFSVKLDLLNLLDSRDHDIEYFYESQLANETAPVADHHYHVFEPRSARVYLEWLL